MVVCGIILVKGASCMANEKNIIPHQFVKGGATARELGHIAGKKSVESKREKKTIAQILAAWADREVSEKDLEALRKLGISDITTNKALLVLPLIKNISKGDVKSLQLAMELLGEDRKKEAEIKKLNEEIERLKLEQERLKLELSGGLEEDRVAIINDIPQESSDK